jgi:hypothetical protein
MRVIHTPRRHKAIRHRSSVSRFCKQRRCATAKSSRIERSNAIDAGGILARLLDLTRVAFQIARKA